jgi:hypothetical protein
MAQAAADEFRCPVFLLPRATRYPGVPQGLPDALPHAQRDPQWASHGGRRAESME